MNYRLLRYFIAANIAFTRKRIGWIYTLLWIIAIIVVYERIIKNNEYVTDREYIKKYIENSNGIDQLSLLGKLLRDEEFDVERNLLTRSIHVNPNVPNDFVPRLQVVRMGLNYGLLEGDSSLYLFKDQWSKLDIPRFSAISRISDSNRLSGNFIIDYDKSFITLISDHSHLIYWDNNLKQSVYSFDASKLARFGAGRIQTLFLVGNSLAKFSEDMDSLYFLPLHVKSALNKMTFEDSIRSVKMPDGLMLAVPYRLGLAVHVYEKSSGRHSLYYISGYGGMTKLMSDDIFTNAVKENDFYWTAADDGLIILFFSKDNSIGIFDPNQDANIRLFKVPKKGYFIDMPFARRKKDVIWLTGITTTGYGVAKVNPEDELDTLFIAELPGYHDIYDRAEPIINVNSDGLVIGNESFKETGEGLGMFQLFHFSNLGNRLYPLRIDSLVDQRILDDLSMFRIQVPNYSTTFEFIASSEVGIGVDYQITPTADKSAPEIIPIINNSADEPITIKWPARKFYSVETIFDYFYTVICNS